MSSRRKFSITGSPSNAIPAIFRTAECAPSQPTSQSQCETDEIGVFHSISTPSADNRSRSRSSTRACDTIN